LSTVLIAVHKDCYTALTLIRQGGPHRRKTILDQVLDDHSPLGTDDDWGRLLRLSDAERTRLGITTIGSYYY